MSEVITGWKFTPVNRKKHSKNLYRCVCQKRIEAWQGHTKNFLRERGRRWKAALCTDNYTIRVGSRKDVITPMKGWRPSIAGSNPAVPINNEVRTKMVDFDDMSKESIRAAFKRKFGEELSENPKEDYCVDGFENVRVNKKYKDLIFGNGAEVQSQGLGDGVFIQKKYVDYVALEGDRIIAIHLKGTKKEPTGKVLWRNEE